jgi:hypothetical protein
VCAFAAIIRFATIPAGNLTVAKQEICDAPLGVNSRQ